MDAAVWFKRIKCLVLVCIFASIGNFISTSKAGNPVTPIEAIPGLVLLLACTLIGCLIYELVGKVSSKNLPAIAYISFIAIFMTASGTSLRPEAVRRPSTRSSRSERSDFFRYVPRSLRMREFPSARIWIPSRNRDLRS